MCHGVPISRPSATIRSCTHYWETDEPWMQGNFPWRYDWNWHTQPDCINASCGKGEVFPSLMPWCLTLRNKECLWHFYLFLTHWIKDCCGYREVSSSFSWHIRTSTCKYICSHWRRDIGCWCKCQWSWWVSLCFWRIRKCCHRGCRIHAVSSVENECSYFHKTTLWCLHWCSHWKFSCNLMTIQQSWNGYWDWYRHGKTHCCWIIHLQYTWPTNTKQSCNRTSSNVLKQQQEQTKRHKPMFCSRV